MLLETQDRSAPSPQQNEAGRAFPLTSAARPAAISFCPCCGHSVAWDKPHVDLNLSTISWHGSIRVSPRRAEILSVLAAAFDTYVLFDTIIPKIYGVAEGESARNTILVELHRTRPALRTIGLKVEGRQNFRTPGIRMFAE